MYCRLLGNQISKDTKVDVHEWSKLMIQNVRTRSEICIKFHNLQESEEL